MTRWGSMWLASQVEGEREPPTSRNDLLGLDVAHIGKLHCIDSFVM